jgi:hypothetical protein
MRARNAKPLTEEEAEAMWTMFGPPPVLSSENKEAYDALRKGYVAYYRPARVWQVSLIRQLVDTLWEVHRQLRYRTEAIERYHQYRVRRWRKSIDLVVDKRKQEVRDLLPYAADYDFLREQVASLETDIATLEARIEEMLQPNDAKHCLALEEAAKYVDKLDKWLKNASTRCNNLLKILEYFCRRVDQENEIAAADDRVVTQNEVKQLAPPVVLPKPAIDDITTKVQPETVEYIAG